MKTEHIEMCGIQWKQCVLQGKHWVNGSWSLGRKRVRNSGLPVGGNVHSNSVLPGYLHLESGCPWGHERPCRQGQWLGSQSCMELPGWTENGWEWWPFREGFPSFNPIAQESSLILRLDPPFDTGVTRPEGGSVELKSFSQFSNPTELSTYYVQGIGLGYHRMDTPMLFWKERKLKPNEGGCKLLSQCFVYIALLTPSDINFFPRKCLKIIGFEALVPCVPCPCQLAVAQRTISRAERCGFFSQRWKTRS